MFNEMQIKAIEDKSNVVVVIAGAGSGKTTVLVERIARLINDGINPINILAITFTNKAAKEMQERLVEKIGPHAFDATICTFHALCVRIIRENVQHLNYHTRYFNILDSEDQKKILKKIITRLNLDIKVPDVLYNISQSKSKSLSYETTSALIFPGYKDIYDEYVKYCQENNAFDFDDLLLVAYHLLKNKEIQAHYMNLFKYIHVDEFQDTSIIQNEILRKLKGKDNNLFIVGDIDQSIYTWRGATVENLLNISDEYENTSIIKLEQNYRSTQKILAAANELIKNNEKRIEKNLWTENKKGRDIAYYSVNTNIDEAQTVVREINALADYGTPYSEFAVLYRYNYQSRKIEELFMKNRIPYKIYGGIRFYERMEVKDMLAYLRLMINQDDNISLLRIINSPKRKVGDKTIEKIENYARENNLTLYETIKEVGSKPLQQLYTLIQKYKGIFAEVDPNVFKKQLNLFVEELGYKDYLLKTEDVNKVDERMNNIEELFEGLTQEKELGKSVEDYIMEISVVKDTEIDSDDMVVLSTIHGVKGLEFSNVFLIGMVNGRFPKEQAFEDDDEMEEERRLAYVGITRAKDNLTLLSYDYDFKYELQEPSIFLEEIGIIDKTQKDETDTFAGFIF